MKEDTVVTLPRPGASVTDDPLLAVLREGARRMLMSGDGYRHKACRLTHAKSTLAVLATPSEQQAAADPVPLRHRRYRAARPGRLLHQSKLIRHAPAPPALHPGNHLDPAAHDRPYP